MEIIDQEDAISCEIDQEEQSGGNQSAARSYECTFCKRGFTNAQALGGHMNVHRKQKAENKKSTSAPSFSSNKMAVDTLKMIIPTPTRFPLAVSTSIAENHGRSRNREETLIIGEEVQQLQLFVEKPSNTNQKLEIHQVLSTEVFSNQEIGSLLQHSSIVSELDLELRLGSEPRNSTSSSSPTPTPTGNTRHFF